MVEFAVVALRMIGGRSEAGGRWLRAASAILVVLCLAAAAGAQVVTATLSGTVADADGALIPNATVVVRNQGNGFLRTVKSGGSGLFSFPSIDSGTYTVTITYTGFEAYVVKNVHLDPGDTRTLNNIKLRAGASDQTVTVEASESSLDTGERSSIIGAEEITKLSTVGRDVTELIKILPGTAVAAGGFSQQGNLGASNTAYDPGNVSPGGALGQFSVSGSPTNGVSIRSDGANLADPASFAASTQNINSESTAEVKVQQSNFGADTANGPVVIDAVGKSGGAEYHGSLYTYARTYQLNSTDAFAAPLNVSKPPDRYVYPGATLGGPVRIPGTDFNHNKKLTFFVSGEDYAQRNTYAYGTASSAISSALVPTANMRKGDFSAAEIAKYLPAGGATSATYANVSSVPVTGANGASVTCNGNTGNDCLSPYLDPGATALINAIFPLPTLAQNVGGFNFSRNNLTNNDLYQTRGRLDFAPSERTKFYAIYNVERGGTSVPQSPGYFAAGSSGGLDQPGGSIEAINSQSVSFNWTQVFSSTLTNEMFANATYYYQQFTQGSSKGTSASIGYPYLNGVANGSTAYPQLYDYNVDGLPIGLFQDYSYGPVFSRKVDPGFGDNLTKVLGRHTIKVGVNIERPLNNQVVFTGANLPSYTQGAIENYYVPNTFYNNGKQYYSSCYTTAGYCGNNNLLATFEEGMIQEYEETNQIPKADLYYWNDQFYATDDWKIMPRLSITFGLRAEHTTNWTDKHGIGASVFNPATINQAASATLPLPGFTWHALDASVPLGGLATRALFYEPRVGFSFDVYGDGKTTIGGGYGQYRYHDGWFDAQQASGTAAGLRTALLQNGVSTVPAGYTLSNTQIPASPGGANGLTLGGLRDQLNINSTNSTFSGSVVGGFVLPNGAPNTSGTPVFGFDGKDSQQPMTATYSLTVTQQLPRGSVISVGYAGNQTKYILNDGSNQPVVVDNVNAIPLGGLFKPDPNPASTSYGITFSPYQINGLTASQVNDYRPYPNYGTVQLEAHKLYANYNALQLTWNKTKGRFNYGANYTWSKAMGVRGGFMNGSPADAFNLQHDYGPLNYDRSNIFNIWYYVPLGNPITKHAVLKQVVNNWALSGYSGVQSGPNLQAINYVPNFNVNGQLQNGPSAQPLQVMNTTFLGTPDITLQPHLICDPRSHLAKHQYMNGACFQLPQVGGQNGDYVFPYIHGPAYFQNDATLIKQFPISSVRNFEFRAAAFNFLNHPLVTFSNSFLTETTLTYKDFATNNPAAATSGNPDFGLAAYKAGRRVLELALKYNF